MNSPPRAEPLRLRRVPLLATAVCFAAGIPLAQRWHPPAQLAAATALLVALTLLTLFKSPRLALVPALAVWLTLGCWCAQIQPPIPQQQPLTQLADGLSRTVQGTVIRVRSLPKQSPVITTPSAYEPDAWATDSAPDTQSIDLAVSSVEILTPDLSTMQPTAGGARLTLSGPPIALHCGDLLELPLRLRTPDVYRDPGAWSYRDQLLTEGIGVTASTNSSRVHILSASHPTLRCRLFAAQTWAANRLQAFVDSPANRKLPHAARLTPEDASMLNAMLFGDRTHLTHTLRNAFERTGTFHLFVVSGLHVALLAAALFWLLRRIRMNEGLAVLLTILTAAAYAELTGFGVPAQRALLMTSIYLIARWLDREITALNALGAASLAVLVLDPRALTQASFQMTFLVILAIAGIAVPLTQRWIRPHARALQNLRTIDIDAHLHPTLAQFRVRLRMACDLCAALLHPRLYALPIWLFHTLYWLADALLFGFAAELCMVLPMALYFHRATLLALPLNLIDIPLLSVLLCVAIVMFVFSLLSKWLAAIPASITALLLHLMRFTVDHFQHTALADLRTPAPTPIAITLAVLCIAVALFALRAGRRSLFLTGLAAAFLIPCAVLYPTPPHTHPDTLEVTALDVGQGDSLLVVSPIGQSLLVDAGGPVGRGANVPQTSWDVGEEVVAPYLWSRHIRRLDAILLTHAHSDHMGGMPAILRDFRPRELWLSIDPGNSTNFRALVAEARDLRIPIRHLHAGDAFPWNGLDATILAPELNYANPGSPVNNDSLVLRLDYGRSSVLLEGDAEAPSEAAMLAHHRLAPATLLKVGHHGSRTSTKPDFLASIAPKAAVISVGAHNTFGHPRGEILARLESAHVRTFRTDRFGAQTFILTPNGAISAKPAAPQ